MKKILTMLLIFSVIFAAIPVTNGIAADVNVYEESKDMSIVLGDDSTGESHTIGQYFKATKSFRKLGVRTASYGNSVGALTFSLYKWQGDYASTVATTPIKKATSTNFADNKILYLSNSSSWPAGEYLWTMSNPVEKVGIWAAPHRNLEADIIQQSYVDGKEHYWCLRSIVTYSTTSATLARNDVVIYLNQQAAGTASEVDIAPIVVRDRTLVPTEYITGLGLEVVIDDITGEIVITNGEKELIIREKEYRMTVDGADVTLDAYADTIGGVLYLPLRAIAEAFGKTVDYFEPGIVVVNTFESSIETAIPIS